MPSFPGELVTTGLLFEGDSVIFCGHVFGLLWLLRVVLYLMLF